MPRDQDHVDAGTGKADGFERGPGPPSDPVPFDRAAQALCRNEGDPRPPPAGGRGSSHNGKMSAVDTAPSFADSRELCVPGQAVVRAHAGAFGI